ncbi:5-formyltetrahydrofolate cyclo-ligase [uncultured Dialister sp.]|jgi:5-formyltetrahydrofolate cyclo-ligase|uniref:5-formyltetrahydrofolate cyclo-ligase n=1 Tax=uncultured Dialister sp. TaxID=278064 RepID=UPI0025E12A96|nr:5-formyltetrahydrofolate cyclo-ligase [uncultured Dialister sp.]
MRETDISSSEVKREIRRKMLALRRALSDDEAVKKAESLTSWILTLPEYKKAKRIMAFLAMKGESNLDGLIARALSDGKEVYVPVCLPERQMEAGRLLDMDHFVRGPLGLRDLPKGYDTVSPEKLDLVLVPGVACDREGNRLGMGAGYYDRYLVHVPFEKRIAALWDFQVAEAIPSEPFDERMAKIVTDKGIIVTKRG